MFETSTADAPATVVSNPEVFGKFIPLIPDAKKIMDDYDKIRANSKDEIVSQLQSRTLTAEADYYQKDVKAFIFKLDLIKQYIADAGNASNYLLLIKASDSDTPTTVIALSHSDDEKNFRIVPNVDGKVPEHPGKSGNIIIGTDTTHEFDKVKSIQNVTFTME